MLSAAADADRELTKEPAFAVQYICTCDNGDEYSLAVSLRFILVYWCIVTYSVLEIRSSLDSFLSKYNFGRRKLILRV